MSQFSRNFPQFSRNFSAIFPQFSRNSIAFGKSTSQRIYSKQRTYKIGKKRHKYDLKHSLHSLDGHFK